jgi:hypothetical protein
MCSSVILGFNCVLLLFLLISLSLVERANFWVTELYYSFILMDVGVLINDNEGSNTIRHN